MAGSTISCPAGTMSYNTSLTFALDPKGHLGLTFSYRNRQLVATGQDVDLANIALSVSY
jgi:hypothetical protein